MEQIAIQRIAKEYTLPELMKDEKFQLIFKQVIADNINRLELGAVYAAVPGEGRHEKANALLENFAWISQRKSGLQENIKQLDIEIADLQGQKEAYTYLLTQAGMPAARLNFLMGGDCKRHMREVLIPSVETKITNKHTYRNQIISELAAL